MPREVCFVTGTRAEFGLMRPVLRAIAGEPKLKLRIIATGMHLDPAHGDGLRSIGQDGWRIDRVVPWQSGSGADPRTAARSTGLAMAAMADAFGELGSPVVLVTGDRVEAFAAASAAHLCGCVVAHVHGGDRAAGQADDCLRHAISKLAHLHFAATKQSAGRLHKMGEDPWRIHCVGSPGLDAIASEAAPRAQVEAAVGPLTHRRYALLVLHPANADPSIEAHRARMLLDAAADLPFAQIVIVYPNNDPGSGGIIGVWDDLACNGGSKPAAGNCAGRLRLHRDLPRPIFLGLLRDAAVLAGNSSSGIIEAASFRTPVLDVGPRQRGRERGRNVISVTYDRARIRSALERIWNNGRPRRATSGNVYGGKNAGRAIADVLAGLTVDERLMRKLIRY